MSQTYKYMPPSVSLRLKCWDIPLQCGRGKQACLHCTGTNLTIIISSGMPVSHGASGGQVFRTWTYVNTYGVYYIRSYTRAACSAPTYRRESAHSRPHSGFNFESMAQGWAKSFVQTDGACYLPIRTSTYRKGKGNLIYSVHTSYYKYQDECCSLWVCT